MLLDAPSKRINHDTEAKSVNNLFEEVFENVQKAAQANFEIQQEMFRMWSAGWLGVPQPRNTWLEKLKEIQKRMGEDSQEAFAKAS